MRSLRRVVIAAIACAALVASSGPSVAGAGVSRRDPQDVESRLDLVFVRYEPIDQGMKLTIRTAERWANKYLSDAGDGSHVAYLIWEFDRDGDRSFDCTGRFFATSENKIRFEKSGPGSQKSFAVRRPTKRSVVVRIPADFCGFRSGSRLRAQSVVTGSTGSGVQVEEIDLAPTLRP